MPRNENKGLSSSHFGATNFTLAPRYLILPENRVAIALPNCLYRTVIDAEDLPLVENHCWYLKRGKYQLLYAATSIRRKTVGMHRLIMNAPPRQWVDHKDRDGLNNTRENLRFCTTAQNCWNRKKPITGKTSRFKGVHWVEELGKYRVQLRGGKGVRIELGWFTDELEAAAAYDAAARDFHGPFARPNGGEVTA